MNRSTPTPILPALALLIGSALVASGTDAIAQDADQIETMVRDSLLVEVEPLDVPNADTVLTTPVFTMRYSLFNEPDDESPFEGLFGGEHRAWVRDGRLVPIYGLAWLSTDDPLDDLDGLFEPTFRLDADSAEAFMNVLRTIMGPDQFEAVPVDAIQNEGDRWYFITGDFLSYYKGFIVTVDEQGTVVDLEYKLSMLDQDG